MNPLESIAKRLEARDYRLTPSRLAVLAALLRQRGHFAVDDILRQVPGVGRATAFRTIKLLWELGILCRVLLEDGSLHYRLSGRGHHHHLVCVACGGVQDMDDCAVSDLVRELSGSTGYQIEGHWLEFYGRCATCAALPAVAKP